MTRPDTARGWAARADDIGRTMDDIADATGIPLEQLRDAALRGTLPHTGGSYRLAWLANMLHQDTPTLLGIERDVERIDADLEPAARNWQWTPPAIGALTVARSWLALDANLAWFASSHRAVERPWPRVFQRRTWPELHTAARRAPAGDDFDRQTQGRELAATLLAHTGPVDDIETVAARVGVPVGSADLDPSVRTIGVIADNRPLIVTASALQPDERARSISHVLAHLVAGDICGALIDIERDPYDDSIHTCAGTGVMACCRADVVAATLGLPSAGPPGGIPPALVDVAVAAYRTGLVGAAVLAGAGIDVANLGTPHRGQHPVR